eukprot:15460769-Alexandrium_andersonii.AAC.1
MASPYSGAQARRRMWASAPIPTNFCPRGSPIVAESTGRATCLPASTSRVPPLQPLRNHEGST